MMRPSGAETLTSAQYPEIANIVASPVAPDVAPSRKLRVAVGKASVVFATTSLAAVGLAGAMHNEKSYDASADSAPAQAANTYTLDNTSRAAREAQDIYRGRVTITLSANTKAAPTPTPSDSRGVAVAKIMGVSETNVQQGKKSEVTIAGRSVDLADYKTDVRTAEDWTKSGDSAWRWAEQDVRMAGKEAGLDDKKINEVANDRKAIAQVMDGYYKDNPKLRDDPQHYLNKGASYQAKRAREKADALVSAMRTVAVPGPTTTQPAAPNQNAPKHAKPENPDLAQPPANAAKPQPSKRANNSAYASQQPTRGASKGEEVFLATLKVGSLSFLGIATLIGAGLGFNWARRRWRNRGQEQPVHAQQPEPDGPPEGPNGGGEDDPTDLIAKLRRITDEDTRAHRDPYFDQPETAGAHRGPVQLDWGPRTATSATPAHSAEAHTAKILTLPQPTPEEIANRNDIPTNPNARIVVVPFQRKKELRGQGWVDEKTGEYHGIHRRLIPEEPASDAAPGKNTSEYHGRHRKPVPEDSNLVAV